MVPDYVRVDADHDSMNDAQIKIRLRSADLKDLSLAASAAGLNLSCYLTQALEQFVAEWRATSNAAAVPQIVGTALGAKGPSAAKGSGCRLPPETVQRVLFLFESEGLNAPTIAQRLNIGEQSVRRIVDARGSSSVRVQTVIQPAPKNGTKRGWAWGDKFLPPKGTS